MEGFWINYCWAGWYSGVLLAGRVVFQCFLGLICGRDVLFGIM